MTLGVATCAAPVLGVPSSQAQRSHATLSPLRAAARGLGAAWLARTALSRLSTAAGGPPERAHGGVVATILDEACGAGIVAAGRVGMTVTLTVDYVGPVPLGVPLGIRARTEEIDGRKTWVTAEIVVDDEVRARGRALFVATRPQ